MRNIIHNYRAAQEGRRLITALGIAGLQLLIVVWPSGNLRAGEEENRNAFNWKNLQSDIAGVAERSDPNLVNSWGITMNSTAGIFWVADNGTGKSTLYRPDGIAVTLGTSGKNFVTLPLTTGDNASTPPATA